MFKKLIVVIFLLVSLVNAQNIKLEKTIDYRKIFPEIKSPVSLSVHFLGNLLIGDDFANQVFAVNPVTLQLIQASNTSNFSPLSNPAAIASDPLNIFVLDYDNQKLLRYDVYMRLLTELNLEDIYDFPINVNIIFMTMDFKKEIYLLDETEYKVFKLNDQNEIIQTFGGVNSNILEFRHIEKFEPCGKGIFFTFDYLKQQIIKFGLTGNLTQEIPLKDEVIDFCGNLEGWLVILLSGNEVILGKNKQFFGKMKLPVKNLNGDILISMYPKESKFWLMDEENLYLFAIENRETN